MNKNHLALFRAVAEEGSFSRGADRLFISQPAVSKQIAELETALGAQLFERIPKGVKLTEAGALLLPYARKMAALEADAELALQQLHGLERGRLAVGASTTIGVYLLPEILGVFNGRYPGLALQLEIGNSEAVQQLLIAGAVDIALTEGHAPTSDLTYSAFMRDELVAIAPSGHALLRERTITAARFCREPLVLREIGSGTRWVVEQALAEHGIRPQPVMSLGSTEAIKRAVAGGIGLSIVSRLSLDQELETGRLVVVPIVDLEIHRPLHLLRRPGAVDSPAVREFLNVLKSRTRKSSSGGGGRN